MNSSVDVLPFLANITQALSDSVFLLFLKWFLILYTLVLIADLILILFLRGVTGNIKIQLYGSERPLVSKSTVTKRWDSIVSRLKSHHPTQYKAALLEADHMADELLEGIGYKGKNMGERLSSIHPGQVESLPLLQAAHSVRNRIVNEPDFVISEEEALVLLESYRKFFVELELF